MGVPLREIIKFFWKIFFGMDFIGKTPHPLCEIIKNFWKILSAELLPHITLKTPHPPPRDTYPPPIWAGIPLC